jgi:hypothetical protein
LAYFLRGYLSQPPSDIESDSQVLISLSSTNNTPSSNSSLLSESVFNSETVHSISSVVKYVYLLSFVGEELVVGNRIESNKVKKSGKKPPLFKLPDQILAKRHGGVLGLASLNFFF